MNSVLAWNIQGGIDKTLLESYSLNFKNSQYPFLPNKKNKMQKI